MNTLESTSFNGFWLNLVLRRVWNPIDFQGQRSRSQGLIFRRGDTPHFALPLLKIFMNLGINRFKVNLQLNILFIRNLHITWLFIKYEWSLFGYWNLYYIRAKALDGVYLPFRCYTLCSPDMYYALFLQHLTKLLHYSLNIQNIVK